jgi:NADPH-dependent 2,4-dienoyl-CoA reductase/sulfur reductase-like enzyme/rhodanese-related sulfurtransferase
LKVIIIGAVALGPKVACRLKRLRPEAQVTMIDRDSIISYGGCGIPYFISGDVNEPWQLQSTSFHMVRDQKFFREAKDIEVLPSTEALFIDRPNKKVRVHSLDTGDEKDLAYDKLVLATGGRPKILPVPGTHLKNVFAVSTMHEAIAIKEKVSKGQVSRAVIIGAGAVGLEMAEAFSDLWGIETSVIEYRDQILPGVVDHNLAKMAQYHMTEHGVNFSLSDKVLEIKGDGKVEQVITDKRSLDADIVITAVGVEPNSDLAHSAGLDITARGAVDVNSQFQTSDPDIYAGGDCVENLNLITGEPVYMPSGALANRHGRIIGTNLAGGKANFNGVVGSFVIKIFELVVAKAGLSLFQAQAAGLDAISAFVVQADRAHFYPEMQLLYMDLIVQENTGRVLGVQGLGNLGAGLEGRVNAVGALLKYGPLVEDVSNLEVAYSPPFSAAMDIINALGNTAENILTGKNRVIEVDEFARVFQERQGGDIIFLDVRGPGNAQPYVEKYPAQWINVPQDELQHRLDEIPRDKKIILICNSGVRSYESQVVLDKARIWNSLNLQGGMAALKRWGLELL